MKSEQKGFTLLIAIIVTSMFLIVSFVVINVALKQLILSYAGEESQYAFYAADSGLECASYWDLKDSNNSAFSTSTAGNITCNSQGISTGSQTVPTIPSQPSRIGGGGNANPTSIFYLTFTKGCAIVQVTKQANGYTNIDSRGYNTCNTSSPRRFERGVNLLFYAGYPVAANPPSTWNLTVNKSGSGSGLVTDGAGAGSISLINHAAAFSGQSGATTNPINTNGANFIVIVTSNYSGGGDPAPVSDSKGNTWTLLNNYANGTDGVKTYYSVNPTVGGGHTFTVAGNSWASIGVAAFSNVASSPVDTQSGANGGTNLSSLQTGSISPTTDSDLIITGLTVNHEVSLSIDAWHHKL